MIVGFFRNARRDLIFLRKQTWVVMGKMVGLRNKNCEIPNKPQNFQAGMGRGYCNEKDLNPTLVAMYNVFNGPQTSQCDYV